MRYCTECKHCEVVNKNHNGDKHGDEYTYSCDLHNRECEDDETCEDWEEETT